MALNCLLVVVMAVVGLPMFALTVLAAGSPADVPRYWLDVIFLSIAATWYALYLWAVVVFFLCVYLLLSEAAHRFIIYAVGVGIYAATVVVNGVSLGLYAVRVGPSGYVWVLRSFLSVVRYVIV
ncbi:MAG: hypothetical protein ABWK05_04935 [Pyrobaculum sp.]